MESGLPFYTQKNDDDSVQVLFAEVILPLRLHDTYTYRVPRHIIPYIKTGVRVIVQFGSKKIYSAVVAAVHQQPPHKYTAKYLLDLLDDIPVVTPKQLEFWRWMADYYCCTMGEVMAAALPANMKLESETRILINPENEWRSEQISDNEYLVLEALESKRMLSIGEISELLQIKNVMQVVKSLYEKGFILLEEEIKNAYRPKKETFVRALFSAGNKKFIEETMHDLEKAPKQLNVFLAFLLLQKSEKNISKKELLKKADATPAALDALVKKLILDVYEEEIDRLRFEALPQKDFILSPEQKNALTEINEHFENKEVVLLHGITGSGKTHVYAQKIKEILQHGKQALYLVPEIALTAQLVFRLRSFFNDEIGIYHSKFNDNERVEIWHKVLSGKYKVVLGVRSALFLPFSDLGLVIVDEEHENTYKQYEPAPRYQARDAAVYMAAMYGAKVLLGSATPSLESYFNAQRSKYGLVKLNTRFGDAELPEISIVNLRDEQKKKLMKSHFSSVMMAAMNETMNSGGQAILFQNRRGYAPMLQCTECGWTPGCPNCDISLTYHQREKQLVCHYCGYKENLPNKCGACGNYSLKMLGFGTEKIEDEVQVYFPDKKILRMDQDSVRQKNSYRQIIRQMEEGEAHILVGTQMVTKGLDFEKLQLVGILSADQMLRQPDFRAAERAYQLMSQVSGRAGRRSEQGRVVVQTWQPENPVFDFVVRHAYEDFYESEIKDRLYFRYPPFYKLIKIIIRHKDEKVAEKASGHLAQKLRDELGSRILGAETPSIGKIRNYFIRQIVVKLERTKTDADVVKKHILVEIEITRTHKDFKQVKVAVDVDP